MSLLCEGLLCCIISVKRSLVLVEFPCGYIYNGNISGIVQATMSLMFYVTAKKQSFII